MFATFVAPLLARMTGEPLPRPEPIVARLVSPVASPVALDHTVPIQVATDVHGEVVALPVLRGAGALLALMHADALLRVPSGCASLPEGAMVSVEPLAGAPAATRRLRARVAS